MKYKDLKFDWFGEIKAKMGYGLQARRMLKPLIDGGADIKLIPDEDYLPPHMKIADPFWDQQVLDSIKKPDTGLRIMYSLPTRFKPGNGVNIGYSMWETDEYPREWSKIINECCKYFFAGCNSLVNSAKKANISMPIIPINATIDTNLWCPEGPKTRINDIPDDCVKFMFIGNFIPRKNLEDLLLGFNAAFEGIKDVCLIIKTWSGDNTANGKKHIGDAVRHLNNKATGLMGRPKIHLISDILDEDQIINLMRYSDVYVSVSKGEGFDLPMMQSMSLGKLILTTRFLAHGDYLNDSNSIDIKYSLMPCSDAAAPLYDSYQMWSRPDMGSYIEGLRKAYSVVKNKSHNYDYRNYSEAARQTIIKHFSEEVNTENLANIIRQIQNEKQSAKQNIKDIIKKLT